MKTLEASDLVDIERYEACREDFRQRLIAYKRDRRIAIGERVTLVFENRETIRFQIQEMIRIERIRSAEAIQQELDVYNELVPGPHQLSATLFVEITDLEEIRPELDRLIGIDEHVSIQLGAGDNRQRIPAQFDAKQMEADRISAVQYVRFGFARAQIEALADRNVPAHLCIDHPNYAREVEIPEILRENLLLDLREEAPALFAFPAAPATDTGPEMLVETRALRAFRPTVRRSIDHVIVEVVDPRVTLFNVEEGVLVEALDLVRRFAALQSEAHGVSRIEADVVNPKAADAEPYPLRWHIFVPRV